MSFRSSVLLRQMTAASSGARRISCRQLAPAFARPFSVSRCALERKFTKEHEWFDTETNQVGITEYAAKTLGDIVFVDMLTKEGHLNAGEPVGSIESVKSVAEVYLPISGTIEKINPTVSEDPSLVNEEPEGEGWLFAMKDYESKEVEELLTAEEYKKYVADGAND